MIFDETAADRELNQEQLELISKLTNKEIIIIDHYLYPTTCDIWQKMARVVGTTMTETSLCIKGIPDVFYSQRVHT